MEGGDDMSSILNDVKHALGQTPNDHAFDSDIMIEINAAIGTLTQIGVGPLVGYQITGPDNEWAEFFTDLRLNAAKSYIILCCKLRFNPPDRGFMIEAMERQKQEMEYRLNVVADYG
jgi:hypothetical protein